MRADLDLVAARYVLARLTSTDVVQLAHDVCSTSENPRVFLQIVVEEKEPPERIIALFEEALREHGVTLPNRHDAGMLVARDFAARMLESGNIDVKAIEVEGLRLWQDTDNEQLIQLFVTSEAWLEEEPYAPLKNAQMTFMEALLAEVAYGTPVLPEVEKEVKRAYAKRHRWRKLKRFIKRTWGWFAG